MGIDKCILMVIPDQNITKSQFTSISDPYLTNSDINSLRFLQRIGDFSGYRSLDNRNRKYYQ